MSGRWEEMFIEDVAQVVNGGTPKTKVPDFWGGDNLWITPAEMGNRDTPYLGESRRTLSKDGLDNCSASLVPEKSVILSTRAPIGHLVINSVPMAFNQGCRALVPGDKLNYKFLYYFLYKNVDTLNELGSGTTFKELAAGKLKRFPIPVPPLAEQKRIVAILDEAFAGIDAAIANTEKNLINARELFESYLNSVFRDTSGDWVTDTIGGLVEKGVLEKPMDGNHGEIHPKKADFVSSGVPFIMASDLVEGGVDQSGCHFISREQSDSLRKGFARDGDVLLSHKGTIGRAAILETELDYVMLTPQVTYYRILESEVLCPRFLFYAFHSPGFLTAFRHIAGAGSTRAYIGITKQLKLEISYPPLRQQERYAEAFDELSRESKRLKKLYEIKLVALKELKQSLLQKAFSGELTGELAEKEMDEAVA